MRSFLLCIPLLALGCGIDSSADLNDVAVEEYDAQGAESALSTDVLNLVPQDVDVAPGQVTGRVARVLTSAAQARALLGPVIPSTTWSRNWLLAVRPDGASASSRLEVTRAQLSGTGQTLSVWVTVTDPGAGCQAWRPHSLAVVRVPSRPTTPSSIRLYVTRQTASCGLTVGGACTSTASCAQPTPFCLGRVERADGSMTDGTCVRLPAYASSSLECANDAACGADGVCAGLTAGGLGLCQPGWMKGTFSVVASNVIPRDGSWARVPLDVRGLSSVAMDAWAQVFTDGTAAQLSALRVRLVNPSGTASAEFTPASMGRRVVVFVPGDESLGGEWFLEVRDTASAGAPVTLRGARLSFTSRWD